MLCRIISIHEVDVSFKNILNVIELKFRIGYDGEECLLRMICETAAEDLQVSGLLEDLFYIIFRYE